MEPEDSISTEAIQVHSASHVIDLHCDLLLTSYFLRWNWSRRHRHNPFPFALLMGHADIPRLREGGVDSMALGIVINPMRRKSGPDAIRSDLTRMANEVLRAPKDLAIARTAQGLLSTRKLGKIGVFGGLEGAHGLNGRLEDLPEFIDAGLGYVGLAHFTANEACSPMVGWGSDPEAGLTDYGRELVDELNRLGLVIDVAHVNQPGLLEVCARTRAPVICSHTACRAVHHSPRGISDAEIIAIANTGGVVGVIFVAPFIGPGGMQAVVRHLTHIRDLVGAEHCALGTDWEGWAPFPRELASAEQLPRLTDALLRQGWKPDEIVAMYGGNFLRVLGEVQRQV